MKEKNIFAYKLFLSLNISDFNLIFMWQLQPTPPEKSHPLFPSNPPLNGKVLSSHPPPLIFENPPYRKKGDAQYVDHTDKKIKN